VSPISFYQRLYSKVLHLLTCCRTLNQFICWPHWKLHLAISRVRSGRGDSSRPRCSFHCVQECRPRLFQQPTHTRQAAFRLCQQLSRQIQWFYHRRQEFLRVSVLYCPLNLQNVQRCYTCRNITNMCMMFVYCNRHNQKYNWKISVYPSKYALESACARAQTRTHTHIHTNTHTYTHTHTHKHTHTHTPTNTHTHTHTHAPTHTHTPAHTHTYPHTHTHTPIGNNYRLDGLGFEFRLGQEIFCLRKPSRKSRVPT